MIGEEIKTGINVIQREDKVFELKSMLSVSLPFDEIVISGGCMLSSFNAHSMLCRH